MADEDSHSTEQQRRAPIYPIKKAESVETREEVGCREARDEDGSSLHTAVKRRFEWGQTRLELGADPEATENSSKMQNVREPIDEGSKGTLELLETKIQHCRDIESSKRHRYSSSTEDEESHDDKRKFIFPRDNSATYTNATHESKNLNMLVEAIETGGARALAKYLGVEYPSAERMEALPPKMHALINEQNRFKQTPLIICAESGNKEALSFLISCGAKVNVKDDRGNLAIDYLWGNENYDSVLELLQANSLFPEKFDETRNENLNAFTRKRNDLHRCVKDGDLMGVVKAIRNDVSHHYLNKENKSALFQAAEGRKYKIYGFLLSKGAHFRSEGERSYVLRDLSPSEKFHFNASYNQCLVEAKDSHVEKLMRRSRILGRCNQDESEKFLRENFSHLDSIEITSALLEVLQHDSFLEICFEIDNTGIEHFGLEDTFYDSYGLADIETNRIYVSGKWDEFIGRPKNDFLGTLANETARRTMDVIYNNQCKPYCINDSICKKKFLRVVLDILIAKHARENKGNLELEDLKNVFKDKYPSNLRDIAYNVNPKTTEEFIMEDLKRYLVLLSDIEYNDYKIIVEDFFEKIGTEYISKIHEGVKRVPQLDDVILKAFNKPISWEQELIIRVPHILARDGQENGKKLLTEQVPSLLQFYEEHVLEDCKNILKTGLFTKSITEIKTMHEYFGLLQETKKDQIQTKEEMEDYTCFLSTEDNVQILKTSSVQLCRSHINQFNKRKRSSPLEETDMFFKWSDFVKQSEKIMEAIKDNDWIHLVLSWDENAPITKESLKSILGVGSKFTLICDESSYSGEKVLHYIWKDLSQSTKKFLLEEKVVFQGKDANLRELIGVDKDQLDSSFLLDLKSDTISNLIEEVPLTIGRLSSLTEKSKLYYSDCYVKRSFSKPILSLDLLKEKLTSTVIVMNNTTKEELISCGIDAGFIEIWEENKCYSDSARVILMREEKEKHENGMIFQEMSRSTFERKSLLFVERKTPNALKLLHSSGSISEILKFVEQDGDCLDQDELLNQEIIDGNLLNPEWNMVIIIAGNPGIGKSCLLENAAEKLRGEFNEYPSIWVSKINLNDYARETESEFCFKMIDWNNRQPEEAMDVLFQILKRNHFSGNVSRGHSSVEWKVVKYLCEKTARAVLIFDGFDEIAPKYRDDVIWLLESLKECSKATVVVSTRLHEKRELEVKLNSMAYVLKPFSREDKVDFMNKYWKKCLKDLIEVNDTEMFRRKISALESKLNVFKEMGLNYILQKLDEKDLVWLNNFAENINFESIAKEAIEILNCSIIDREDFCSYPLHLFMLATIVFDKDFMVEKNLVSRSTYKTFIDWKFEICRKKISVNSGEILVEETAKEWEANMRSYHQNIAAVLYKYEEKIKVEEESVKRVGLVFERYGGLQFIHHTFSEYFFAQWWMKNSVKSAVTDLWFDSVLLDGNFIAVRRFINDAIEDGSHNMEIEWNTTRDELKMKAVMRTLLHVLVSEGLLALVRLLFRNSSACESIQGKLKEMLKTPDEDGATALHIAIAKGDLFREVWIIYSTAMSRRELETIIQMTDKMGRTVFHRAALVGDIFAFNEVWNFHRNYLNEEKLPGESLILKPDNSGNTVLHLVVRNHGDSFQKIWSIYDETQTKKELRESLLMRNCYKHTILHSAVLHGDKYLLKTIWTKFSENLSVEECCKILLQPDIGSLTIFQLAIASQNIWLLIELWKIYYNAIHDEVQKQEIKLGKEEERAILRLAVLEGNKKALVKGWQIITNARTEECLDDILEISDKEDNSILHKCVLYGEVTLLSEVWNIVSSVVSKGKLVMELRFPNKNGNTILQSAALSGDVSLYNEVLKIYSSIWPEDIDDRGIQSNLLERKNIIHKIVKKGYFSMFFHIWKLYSSRMSEEELIEMLQFHSRKECAILPAAAQTGNVSTFNKVWEIYCNKLGKEKFVKFLKFHNEEPNQILHKIMEIGNDTFVTTVCKNYANILSKNEIAEMLRSSDRRGNSALHIAAETLKIPSFREVWETFTNQLSRETVVKILRAENRNGETILHKSMTRQDESFSEVWKIYINTLSEEEMNKFLQSQDRKGNSVLHRAVETSNIAVFREVWETCNNKLSRKIVVEILRTKNENDDTILCIAMTRGDKSFSKVWNTYINTLNNDEMAEFLQSTDREGNSVLHRAAESSNIAVLRDVWETCNNQLGHKTLAQILRAENKTSDTILHKAMTREDDPIFSEIWEIYVNVLSEAEILEILQSTGSKGNLVLHGVVENLNIPILWEVWETLTNQLSQEVVANILRAENENGNSILHKALARQDETFFSEVCKIYTSTLSKEEMITFLQSPRRKGNSVLHRAAETSNIAVFRKVWETYFEQLGHEMLVKILRAENRNGDTIFHQVITREDEAIFSEAWKIYNIMLSKEDLTGFLQSPDRKGNSVLHRAAETSNIDTFRKVWETYTNHLGHEIVKILKAENVNGETILHKSMAKKDESFFSEVSKIYTSMLNKEEMIKFLQIPDRKGNLVLHRAAETSNIDIFRKVQDTYTNHLGHEMLAKILRAENDGAETVLHKATTGEDESFFIEVSKLYTSMLNRGEWFEFLQSHVKNGNSILHRAAETSNTAVFRKVWETYAKQLTHEIVVKILRAENGNGDTILHKTMARKDESFFSKVWNIYTNTLSKEEMINFLTFLDSKGFSVLFRAANTSNIAIFREVWETYIEQLSHKMLAKVVRLKNEQGETMLHKAVTREDEYFFREVWKIHASTLRKEELIELLYLPDREGNSVLHRAAETSNIAVFREVWETYSTLLNHGVLAAILTDENEYGNTILHIVMAKGDEAFYGEVYGIYSNMLSKEEIDEIL